MRSISHPATWFYKFFMPTAWILGAGSVYIWKFLISDPNAIAFLIALIFGAIIFYLFFGRLKKVSIDEQNLMISNFRRETTVPLSNFLRASGSIGGNIEIICLHFEQETEFGKSVIFMPPSRFFAGFSYHPLVQELNAIARISKHHGA